MSKADFSSGSDNRGIGCGLLALYGLRIIGIVGVLSSSKVGLSLWKAAVLIVGRAISAGNSSSFFSSTCKSSFS